MLEMSDYKSIKSDDYSEFSPRFNLFLTEAGFTRGHGRLTEFASFYNVQKSTARRWVTQNFPPKDTTLKDIVEVIKSERVREIPKHISSEELFRWLKAGGQNPFATPLEKPAKTKKKSPFQRKCRAYLDVYKIAMAQGVDICTLDDDSLEKLYDQVFKDIEVKGLSNPNAEMIAKILKSPKFTLAT